MCDGWSGCKLVPIALLASSHERKRLAVPTPNHEGSALRPGVARCRWPRDASVGPYGSMTGSLLLARLPDGGLLQALTRPAAASIHMPEEPSASLRTNQRSFVTSRLVEGAWIQPQRPRPREAIAVLARCRQCFSSWIHDGLQQMRAWPRRYFCWPCRCLRRRAQRISKK
jgi:hypothetical protein